jgi:hypothetical protein
LLVGGRGASGAHFETYYYGNVNSKQLNQIMQIRVCPWRITDLDKEEKSTEWIEARDMTSYLAHYIIIKFPLKTSLIPRCAIAMLELFCHSGKDHFTMS